MEISESLPDPCPICGKSPVSKCVYGLIGEPYHSEILKDDEYIMMGCNVSDSDPIWYCKKCETMFFTPDTRTHRIMEWLKEQITGSRFWITVIFAVIFVLFLWIFYG